MNDPALPQLTLAGENIGVERGGIGLVEGLSFTLERGQALVVTGSNGAGKSSLLRAIAGLLPLSGGEIRLDEDGEASDMASACHFLGHQHGMKPALTVQENLEFWQGFSASSEIVAIAPNMRDMPIADALAQFQLGHVIDMPFAYLSAGQKRRASAARLLVNARPVWILDEPTSALDNAAAKDFEGLMESHLSGGGLLIAATHRPLDFAGAHQLDLDRHRAGVSETAGGTS